MMMVMLHGMIQSVRVCNTKDERDYLLIHLSVNNSIGARFYWRCKSFLPRHIKLVGALWEGRRIMIYGQITDIEAYVSKKTSEPSAEMVMTAIDIQFLDPPKPGEKV